MKKKLGIILAILLCVVMIFTLVACKKNKTEDTPAEEEKKTESTDALDGVSDAEKAKIDSKIQEYINKWLDNHGEMEITDQSAALKADLVKAANEFKQKDKNGKASVTAKTPTVTFDAAAATYTVVYTWNKTSYSKTFTGKAIKEAYKDWAGYNLSKFTFQEDPDASSEIADKLIASVVKVVNDITTNAPSGKFGAQATVGVDVAGHEYGMLVKGNVDVTAKANNEIGLAIVNMETGKELGGIYYKAAATAKDSRLYIQYAQTDDKGDLKLDNKGNVVYDYKYIEYVDIFGWIGDNMPEAQAGKPVFTLQTGKAPTSLAEFLTAVGGGKYSDIIASVVSSLMKPYKNGNVYLLDLNLGDVMTQVSDIVDGVGVKLDFLDKIGLNLSTMHGLKGHISLSAEMDNSGALTDFQIALNIPKCTFYFSDAANATHFDIPAISFALNIKDYDFSYGNDRIAGVVPAEAATKAEVFSPTNLDLSGDVYVGYEEEGEVELDRTFHFDFVTDVNPLEIIANGAKSDAKGVLSIKASGVKGTTFVDTKDDPATNFLTISYEQASKRLTVSGEAFAGEGHGDDVYSFYIVDDPQTKENEPLEKLSKWIGLGNWIGLDTDEDGNIIIKEDKEDDKGNPIHQDAKESAKAIFGDEKASALVNAIIAHYKSYKAEITPKDEEQQGEENAQAAFNVSDIGDYFEAFKTLYEKYVEAGKIVINTDGTFSFKAEVDKAMIDDVIDTLNKTFELTIPKTNDSKYAKYYPEYVNVYLNDADHKNQFVVEVKHNGIVYTVLFDNSKDKKFIIDFTMAIPKRESKEARTYKVTFTAETLTEGGWKATVVVNILDKDGNSAKKTTVSLSNFHGKWGGDYSAKAAELIPSTEGELDLFPQEGNGPMVAVLETVRDLLTNDKVMPYVKKLGNFIVEQVAEKQVADAAKKAA